MFLPTILYISVLTLLRFLKAGIGVSFYGSWPLVPGVLLGTQFVWFDRWVVRYLRSRELLSQDRLLTQNILFAYGWIIVAFFGMTSTASLFGKGVVMGIGLQLAQAGLKDEGRGTKDEQNNMSNSFSPPDFFWPIKRQLSEKEKKWGIGIFLIVFVGLTIIL